MILSDRDGARRRIGYWRSDNEPDLPDPRDFVDPDWDPHERQMVLDYLRAKRRDNVVHGWRGFSWCRFGDKSLNGTTCVGDDAFIWPEGFAHYIEVHHVRPPVEFVDHVRAQGSQWLPGPAK